MCVRVCVCVCVYACAYVCVSVPDKASYTAPHQLTDALPGGNTLASVPCQQESECHSQTVSSSVYLFSTSTDHSVK